MSSRQQAGNRWKEIGRAIKTEGAVTGQKGKGLCVLKRNVKESSGQNRSLNLAIHLGCNPKKLRMYPNENKNT